MPEMSARLLIKPNLEVFAFRDRNDDITDDFLRGLFAAAAKHFRGRDVVRFVRDMLLAMHPAHVGGAHNLVVNTGLIGWTYNLANTDGDVLTRFLGGSGTTAVELTDTGLDTELFDLADPYRVLTGDLLVVGHWLTGANRDSQDGNTLAEIGTKTNDGASGKASDNVLVNRAVLNESIALDTRTTVIFILNFVCQWAPRSGEQGLNHGLEFVLSKMYDLTTYGVLDRVRFGSSATQQKPWKTGLVAQTHNASATYSASGATVSASGTLPAGAGAGAAVREFGPASSGTAGVFYQIQGPHVSADNVANDVDWDLSITLANAETADLLELESGDHLLLEDGTDKLQLESS